MADPVKVTIANLMKSSVSMNIASFLRDKYPGAEIRVDTADNLVATVMIRAKDCQHPDMRFMGTRHFQIKLSEVM